MMSNNKLKNLIHYICRECGSDPSRLGKVKLQKILFLTDMWKFRITTESLTGSTYQKYPFGPFNNEVDSLLIELECEHKLQIIPRDEYSEEYDTVGLVGKGSPDISEFTDREIRLVKENIEYVCDHTASSISEKTHGDVWKMAEMKEEMPLEAYIADSLINTTDE